MAFQPTESKAIVSVLKEHTTHLRRGLDVLGREQMQMTPTLRTAIIMAQNARRALDQAVEAMDRELGYIIDPSSKPKLTPPPGMEDVRVNPLGEPDA